MEEISVPPGFVSLSSFTLKRIDDTKETDCYTEVGDKLQSKKSQLDALPHIVDIEKLKRSLRQRPWILNNQLDHSTVENESPIDEVQGTSTFVDSCLSDVVSRSSTLLPDGAIKVSIGQAKSLTKEENRQKKEVSSSGAGFNTIPRFKNEKGTSYRGCEMGEDIILVSTTNSQAQAHGRKEEPVKESSGVKCSGKVAIEPSGPTQDDPCKRNVTEELSRQKVDIVVLSDDD